MQYDDNYEEYENDENNDIDYDQYHSHINFLNGEYKIEFLSELSINIDTTYCTFIVTRTGKELNSKKTLIDIFSLFEESFFLEFLMSVLTSKNINVGSIKKIISVTENSEPCICISASFSSDQRYIHIEDEIETDELVTDTMMIGNMQTMRTHQYLYCTTQAAKCCIVKYDVMSNRKFDWYSDGIDWLQVYSQLIEPYIKFMISCALKCQVDSVMQHSDYMTFHLLFAINRGGPSFYAEIYILPKTVLNHKIIYNSDNGREILIGCKNNKDDREFTSDELRMCLGSQNLNLIPINNLNTKMTFDNAEPFIVSHELSTKDDLLINYFALSIDRYTKIPKEFCVYLNGLEGFDNVIMDLPINDKSVKAGFLYLSLLSPTTKESSIIKITDEVLFCGVLTFMFENKIPNDVYNHTILNTDSNMFIPKVFFDRITMAYKFNDDTKYGIIPIRALPQYREYMLFAINPKSDTKESQSDIISKNESENNNPSKKKGFFSSLLNK